MKKRNKIIIIIGIFLLVLAVRYNGIIIFLSADAFRAFTVKSRLDTILHKTNHQALLNACRMLMKQGYKGQYNVFGPDRHPDVEKFPKEILALKPTYIDVEEEGRVIIEMWGGMSHYGLVAYAEDFKETYKGYKYGNKKLIDGLWFYSDFIDLNEKNK